MSQNIEVCRRPWDPRPQKCSRGRIHAFPKGENFTRSLYIINLLACYDAPQQAESFSFFVISDQARFKTDLKSYKPTTSEDVVETLYKIEEAKRKAEELGESVKHVDTVQTQIAFSRTGLKVLGVEGETKDSRFDKGPMSLDKESLGDANDWDPVFANGIIHGVIVVATSGECPQFH